MTKGAEAPFVVSGERAYLHSAGAKRGRSVPAAAPTRPRLVAVVLVVDEQAQSTAPVAPTGAAARVVMAPEAFRYGENTRVGAAPTALPMLAVLNVTVITPVAAVTTIPVTYFETGGASATCAAYAATPGMPSAAYMLDMSALRAEARPIPSVIFARIV